MYNITQIVVDEARNLLFASDRCLGNLLVLNADTGVCTQAIGTLHGRQSSDTTICGACWKSIEKTLPDHSTHARLAHPFALALDRAQGHLYIGDLHEVLFCDLTGRLIRRWSQEVEHLVLYGDDEVIYTTDRLGYGPPDGFTRTLWVHDCNSKKASREANTFMGWVRGMVVHENLLYVCEATPNPVISIFV